MEVVRENPTEFKLQDHQILSDLHHIEQLLHQGVDSTTPFPKELSQRLIQLGGKRIRPMLLCLIYRSLEHCYTVKPRASRDDLYTLAAVSELVHTATLFHDDVLDFSPERRKAPSAHMLHGNKVSILVGDFVYAEAFARLMERGLLEPSQKLASTIKSLVEGELLQHDLALSRKLSWKEFLITAEAKTASLFAWCCEVGAWATGLEFVKIARRFGADLGLAFQFADDILDFFEIFEKPFSELAHSEWLEAAPPLPLVCAYKLYPLETQNLWNKLDNSLQKLPEEVNKILLDLYTICRRKEVLDLCEEKVLIHISAAEEGVRNLGSSQELKQSVELIRERAFRGLKLGRKEYLA